MKILPFVCAFLLLAGQSAPAEDVVMEWFAAAGGTVSVVAHATGADYAASVTTVVPTGTTTGHRVFAFVSHDTNDATVNFGTGWTQIATVGMETSAEMFVAWKDWETGETSYTFTSSGSAGTIVSLVSVAKTGGTWNMATSTKSASSNTLTTTTIDTIANSVLLIGFGGDGTYTVSTPPADMTARSTTAEADALGESDPRMVTYSQDYASATTGITKAITWSSSDEIGAIAVAIGAN